MKKALLVLAAVMLMTANSAFAYHILIFDLPEVEYGPDPSIWTSFVDGVSLRIKWKDLETSKGVYAPGMLDWLTKMVNKATNNGKQIELRILIEGNNAPDWLYSEPGLETFTPPPSDSDQEEIWVYWDPIALAEVQAMYQELASLFGTNPTVSIISAGCDSQGSGDWTVPHTQADINTWAQISPKYTTALNVQGCNQLIDTIAQSFPISHVYMAAGRNGNLDGAGNDNLVAYTLAQTNYQKYPSQFILGKNSWATQNQIPWPNQTAIGTYWEIMYDFYSLPPTYTESAQALWPVYGDTADTGNPNPTYTDNAGIPDTAVNIMAAMMQIAYRWRVYSLEVYEPDCLHLAQTIINGNG